jgi:hypothetical protein
MAIIIPKGFYRDHVERDLPAPPIVRETKAAIWIDPTHPDYAELLDDANHYAHPWGPDSCPDIVRMAKAMLKAIKRQGVR